MTTHDFTTLVDRTPMGSAKWRLMTKACPDLPAGIPPFSVADLDMPTAPEISEGLADFLRDGVMGYTRPTEAFTASVVDWMRRRHGWQVDPGWICQSPGVVPAFFAAVRAFTEPGDGVIIQTPAYYPFYRAIETNGRTVVRNPLVERDGRFEMDLDELERLAAEPANKVLLFCSPHNPTGRVWTRDELERVGRIVVENDLVLVSDEIHFDLVMPGHEHVVMSTLGDEVARRTIVCTAPSKTFNLAGMGLSNIIISDDALREAFVAEQMSTGFFSCTTLGYVACELAYTRAESWLDDLLQLVDHNRKLVTAFLAEHLPGVRVFDLEGTYLQWMDFRCFRLDAAELQRVNEQEAHVFFDEGPMFGPEGAGFERMNIAAPTTAVQAALERLAAAYGALPVQDVA